MNVPMKDQLSNSDSETDEDSFVIDLLEAFNNSN